MPVRAQRWRLRETSPGNRHNWLLSDELTLEDYDGVHRRLIKVHASDKDAKDSSRVLRVPGFFHCKREPFMTRIVSDNAAAELRAVIKGVLETDCAPKAFAFLNSAVHDVNMPARVRVDAAKIIVDRAGYVAALPAADAAHKGLEAMSMAELEAIVREVEAKLKDVTPRKPEEESGGEAPADDIPQPH